MELFIIHEDGSLAEQCEMQLVAKDGLYMLRIPRRVQHVVLPASGRCMRGMACCCVPQTQTVCWTLTHVKGLHSCTCLEDKVACLQVVPDPTRYTCHIYMRMCRADVLVRCNGTGQYLLSSGVGPNLYGPA